MSNVAESMPGRAGSEFIKIKTTAQPFAAEIAPEKIKAEIEALLEQQPGAVLINNDTHLVVLAKGSELKDALLEIGRRRAITFENANEGIVGNSRDLDRFDEF